MKKIIITIVIITIAATSIGYVLTNNKKKNEAKVEVVSKKSGIVPVNISTVSRQNIDLSFTSNGNFAASQDLKMMSENSGRVVAIHVKEGSIVHKGQTLAIIDDKYLSLDLENANEAYQKLKIDKARYESSFQTGGVTKAQLDDIDLQLRNAANRVEQARRKSGDAHIKAPISGIINKKNIEVGAYLSPGTQLFEIVDVSNLKLNISVNERQVVQLKTGNKVNIKVPVFPDADFSGTITFIAPKADASLNFPIEISVDNNKENKIKAGMYGSATFSFAEQETAAIIIPRSAFVGSVNNNQVYVLNSDNTVTLKTVTSRRILGEQVEVIAGLEEGEVVVTTGQINLTNGAKVEVNKQ